MQRRSGRTRKRCIVRKQLQVFVCWTSNDSNGQPFMLADFQRSAGQGDLAPALCHNSLRLSLDAKHVDRVYKSFWNILRCPFFLLSREVHRCQKHAHKQGLKIGQKSLLCSCHACAHKPTAGILHNGGPHLLCGQKLKVDLTVQNKHQWPHGT